MMMTRHVLSISILDRTGVQRELQKALRNLVSTQPEDPISFLAKQYPLY